MLIASRNSFMAGGWKNPYPYMDSCCAWWDGEWNAGIGLHDPSSTKWKDLVGSNDVEQFNRYVYFGDNYIHMPSFPGCAAFTPYAVGYIKTIEVVIKPNGYNAQVFVGFSSLNGQANRWFGIRANATFNFAQTGDCADVSSPTDIHYYAGTSSSDLTSAVPFSGLFLDGQPVTNKGPGMSWGGLVQGGSFNEVASSLNAADYYVIRLHTRELSADEIAANYSVDKARFNLP